MAVPFPESRTVWRTDRAPQRHLPVTKAAVATWLALCGHQAERVVPQHNGLGVVWFYEPSQEVRAVIDRWYVTFDCFMAERDRIVAAGRLAAGEQQRAGVAG